MEHPQLNLQMATRNHPASPPARVVSSLSPWCWNPPECTPWDSILVVMKLVRIWVLICSIRTEMRTYLLFDYYTGDFFQWLLLCNYPKMYGLKPWPFYYVHGLMCMTTASAAGSVCLCSMMSGASTEKTQIWGWLDGWGWNYLEAPSVTYLVPSLSTRALTCGLSMWFNFLTAWWPQGCQTSYMVVQGSELVSQWMRQSCLTFCETSSVDTEHHHHHTPMVKAVPPQSEKETETSALNGRSVKKVVDSF